MMTETFQPTVFLVDDDEGIRRALSRALRTEGFDVEVFESAEDFLSRFQRSRRGCIVLDMSMPGIDGLQLQSKLAEAGVSLPVVFLTGQGDIPMTVRALKGGAVDFLTKPVSIGTLVAVVGEALHKYESTRHDDSELAEIASNFAALSGREKEVLVALAEGKINKQIASDLGVVEQTVKFHRARSMKRMGARTAAELMHMVARVGVGSRREGGGA